MPRRIDAILKRERALELLSKRVIGGLGRSHGQQSKVIQINSIPQFLNSNKSSDCDAIDLSKSPDKGSGLFRRFMICLWHWRE
ncbi:hypothetical protein N8616_05610 [Verrucomicrobia bacterium]|nr:hypothetical protein [Verrucomicrobiota bacterium]MDA7533815.1 hypothetical protein [Verrucomicrobiota bacterium]